MQRATHKEALRMNAPVPARRASAAYRYLFVAGLGLLVGLIATVMVSRALQARQDPFPTSLMQVMSRQTDLLRDAQAQNRCSLADSVPRLQTLRSLSNDLDLAFPALKDSAQFQQHASALRATLNTALAAPPTDCVAMGQLIEKIQTDCKACHQDFR
jgi:cytochrome c556